MTSTVDQLPQMTDFQGETAVIDDEVAIREQRQRTNELIAAHQAEALRSFYDPEIKVIRGDGSLVIGIDAMVQLFEMQFNNPDFVTYFRKTATVTIDKDIIRRAAETGTWIGSWCEASGEMTKTGQYLAVWKKTRSQWVLESELYVALGGTR